MAGALDHCCELISDWRAGSGLRQEALGDDVEDAGVGEVGVEGGVEGALEAGGLRDRRMTGLKSATAMRMLEAPLEVSVLNQSCACRVAVQTRRRGMAARLELRRAARRATRFEVEHHLSYGRRKK